MRTSKDIYKLPDGRLVAISGMQERLKGASLWSGYDYVNQQWIHEGKPDTRTLEELQASLKASREVEQVNDAIKEAGKELYPFLS